MIPVLTFDGVQVFHGDCRDVMRDLPDASVDSVVTDPPYELGFMGKGWDATGVAYDAWLWLEVLRVLKPGGHLLAFGGTRTWHRLAVAIEDAGFEVRDSIAWMYGSGFPKSHDVSKAIDKAAGAQREVVGSYRAAVQSGITGGFNASKADEFGRTVADITAPATPAAQQWQGWGTALKPAFEPIVVARKPLIGTVAENVLAHGTGALNIDGCRIGTDQVGWGGGASALHEGGLSREGGDARPTTGRWPANVILDESQAAELDAQSGDSTSVGIARFKPREVYNADAEGYDITGSEIGYGDTGGASRFFYCAKAPKKERPNVDGIAHPTVKPLKLMEYLVRLVTPPGGTVLEPFAGSGATIEAAVSQGFHVIGIEQEWDYIRLIEARLNKPIQEAM